MLTMERGLVFLLIAAAMAFLHAGCAQQSLSREPDSVAAESDGVLHASTSGIEGEAASSNGGDGRAEEHGHRHHVGLFIGGTHVHGED
jgi:hypothetical protein